ncbi:hypothetical protein KMW28_19720 [Flammeovirga yaeyamensis]|uniref:Uncharacterized protein n=1 Tax=Flammeovirga yaeyamensis TaxID=367791 RepID=A0AAX1N2U3_9BACT|nr:MULTISPECIES: hypothetical protein [Flammeovirga]ANQ50767.1 hypothetical protein MY04_3408 [Flammeovirga sp. MY04]MBB3701520.1 hypothetical protein [Flammeovirga yaeyamensis]NMF38666.1 hypothetical protein [Flammeovirga yaeyamensis]QWG01839.1 hypothetical protein KMW28_19720 [Flammeovirga yaeyamensis]
MKTKLLSFLLLLLSFTYVNAQEAKFMVLGAKGEITSDGKKVNVGDMLVSNASVKVNGTNPYLGLAYIAGGTLELTKKGSFEVNDLEKKLSNKNNDLVSKYVDFIKDELTGSSGETSSQAKYGSVTRSLKKKPIYFYAPINSNAIKSEVTLTWALKEGVSSNDKFKIYIKDRKQHVLVEDDVQGTSYKLDLNDAKLKDQKYLFYYVEDASNHKISSDMYAFQVYMMGEDKETDKELAQLKENNTAIGHLILAKYYEDKGFIVNASSAYEKAIALSNGDKQYTKMYQDFQSRYGS